MADAIDTGGVSEEGIREAAVDRIRDILIGTQIRDLTAQIQQTEARLCEAIDAAQQATESRLKHIENHVNQELTALSIENQRMSENCDTTISAVEKIQSELRNELGESMRELDQRFSATVAKLQRQFEERLNGLLGKVEAYRHSLTGVVGREVQRLVESERFRDSLATFMIDFVREVNRTNVTPQESERMIKKLAYLRSKQRGFVDGDPEQDWREAEAEVERVLMLLTELRNAGHQISEVEPPRSNQER